MIIIELRINHDIGSQFFRFFFSVLTGSITIQLKKSKIKSYADLTFGLIFKTLTITLCFAFFAYELYYLLLLLFIYQRFVFI